MSNQVYKVFEEIEFKAKLLAQYWNNFHTEISQHLPESYQPEIQELSDKLETALTQLVYELQNPTLTLATTGTTSSGKSTLVNLLCGAEIVPVAVSEMSAGAVTIEYSKEKSLIIHETPGALWECGEWKGISDDKIYQRLYKAMISYIENRETQPNLACPQSTITYPFRLLKESQLQLPKGTRVSILDLPGLAYVGDQGNANVIKQECQEALCIVTYNSAETDKEKVKILLQEVVQQVKDLEGSPARMLFVLNKIDVFRADRNWPETENRFIQNTISSIKNELTERLKEYTEEIEKLEVVKLSTLPAFLSLQIVAIEESLEDVSLEDVLEDLSSNEEKWTEHDKSRVAKAQKGVDICTKAQQFTGLIDRKYKKGLSAMPEEWSKQNRLGFAEGLWKISYAEEFQQNLRDHITQHFPKLVIPEIIKRFHESAGDAIGRWSLQTTTAILNSSEEKYQKECENISHIRSSLELFLQVSNKQLRDPFEKLETKVKQVLAEESDDDVVTYIREIIDELQRIEPYSDLNQKLFPLFAWSNELRRGLMEILEAVAKSLETGRVSLDSPNLKKADVIQVKLLESCLKRLVDLDYTASVAKNGTTIEAKTEAEKKKLKQLNDELNQLALHLNIVINDVLKQISKQELNRIFESVSELFRCHLSYLEKRTNDIASNMAITFPDSELSKVDKKLEFNFQFRAGFTITEGTWLEKKETLSTGYGTDQTKITIQEAHRRNTKGKSGWDWLGGTVKGFFNDFIYEGVVEQKKYIDYTPRPSDNAVIPSLGELFETWIIQTLDEQTGIVNQITKWLFEQIDVLKKNVDKIQNDIIDRYQERLDKAKQEIAIDYEQEKNLWLPMQEKAKNLKEEFSGLKLGN
ncbi:dynamin family protein [Anabaena sp. UHCC 0451]|uniref:dynamin family protein n=1 Tax=Anabaena sp. UHCC 0451 TaxID=2055235 RepID=UPI002B217596|nr:dynamin family protein [Anabaena sp. UHCC 0451]MEA5576920.1 dynamin family protein [Anabaena sp. UHCC 0451]